MSAPSFAPSPTSAAPTMMAIPPYAGPAHGSGVTSARVLVGPFVPAAQRPADEMTRFAGDAMATAGQVVRAMPVPATAVPLMEVPASIPPYRPLRPIPFAAPATRSPLYIPPVATPAGEPVVEDEGMIEPQLIDTAEFAIPSLNVGAPHHTAPALGAGDAPVGDPSAAPPLPWIDAFLASTPAMPMVALDELPRAESIGAESLVAAPLVAAPLVAAPLGAELVVAEPVEIAVSADEWPLEEAADDFRALRAAIDDSADRAAFDLEDGDPIAATPFPPLPEWRDDDLMDIMPSQRSRQPPPLQPHTAAESTPEEAAHAFELLARRVRAGELTLPSYDPRMGEPAALVAALAALLGVKLR